jgi:signal-transduction protein with cAMP-binding, CBS, and nucleotidyltransferase domain
MISINFLEKVEVFQGLNTEQLAAIKDCCRQEEFKHETILMDEGEEANHLWIVKEGRVDLRFDLPGLTTSEENTISSILEAGAFGWSSFVPPYKYRLSGYCASKSCKLIKIEKECLIKLFEKDPSIGYVVMSSMATVVGRRFHRLQEEAAKSRGQNIMGGW